MDYSYYFGFLASINFSIPEYLFLASFAIFITLGILTYMKFKVNSNYTRIISMLIYAFLWFLLGGLICGFAMSLFIGIAFVLINEFSGDYS